MVLEIAFPYLAQRNKKSFVTPEIRKAAIAGVDCNPDMGNGS